MNRNRLQAILSAMPGKHILVLGDLMLDEFLWGEVHRISPEAPVPVVAVRRRSCTPGGAANTAANVASLGGQVVLGGVVGTDAYADALRQAIIAAGVNADGLLCDAGRMTTTKTRIIAHSQQVVRMDCEELSPLSPDLEERLLAWAEEQLARVEACILSDYAKGVLSPRLTQGVIARAARRGRPVIVDPKGTDYSKYRGATLVKPNISEVERCVKRDIHDEAGLVEAGLLLAGLLEGSSLLVTRGPQGMSLFEKGAAPVHIPSAARSVFDVTGAGDTVAGTFALALAAGATLREAAQLANYAAGCVVGKVGTATLTLAELRHELSQERDR